MIEVPDGSSDRKESLDQIRIAAERARGLVGQILAFGGRVETERRIVDAAHVVGEAVDLVRATLPATIELRRALEADMWVSADPTQLTQVVINLCTNAAHSMAEGGVLDVRLGVVEIDESSVTGHGELTVGPKVRLTVSDTGVGIPPELLDRVFDPFFTTKDVGVGTGLGLSQAHGIVAAHEGTILVYSEMDMGTTVQVFLPLVVNDAVTATEGVRENGARTGTERVLLIDDQPAVANLGRQILESLGYSVEVELDPATALVRYERAPDSFQAIVTDLTMPGMTGLQLIDSVRTHRPEVPVVLMSGHAENASSTELKAQGIEFLMKPFTRRELSRSLRTALDGIPNTRGRSASA